MAAAPGPSGMTESYTVFSLPLEDFPSIIVTEILSYLTWADKLNAVRAIPSWKPHLHTTSAWPVVFYGQEADENVYFVKEKRANFLVTLKIYGKYLRRIKLAFGNSLGRSGVQILNAIAEHCTMLKHFFYTPQENVDLHVPFDSSVKKKDVTEVCNILQSCQHLQQVSIMSPKIVWSDPVEAGTNLMLELCDAGVADKVTELHLDSYTSLIDHDDYLTHLQYFTGLHKLTIRREKINESILMTLVQNGLQEICLYQDEELALVDARQLGERFWAQVIKINPNFRVDLILQYILVIKDSFVTNLPLRSIVLDDLVNIVTKGVIDHLVSNYKETLENFTYTNLYLENFESGDSRLPGALVSMATKCKKLHTIKYGFPLSSTTILLLASLGQLQELVVPAVEVSYEFDWTIQEGWDADFVDWLKTYSRSEKLLEEAVTEMMGRPWELRYENLRLERSIGLNLHL